VLQIISLSTNADKCIYRAQKPFRFPFANSLDCTGEYLQFAREDKESVAPVQQESSLACQKCTARLHQSVANGLYVVKHWSSLGLRELRMLHCRAFFGSFSSDLCNGLSKALPHLRSLEKFGIYMSIYHSALVNYKSLSLDSERRNERSLTPMVKILRSRLNDEKTRRTNRRRMALICPYVMYRANCART
jgi:hypothetical protein